MSAKPSNDLPAVAAAAGHALPHPVRRPNAEHLLRAVELHAAAATSTSARFRRAWEEVVDRHPVLRTAFAWQGLDQPLQVVRRRVTLPFESGRTGALSAEPSSRRALAAVACRRTGDRAST